MKLVKRGTCFIAVKIDDDNYRFYPSRFIGYISNNMNKHESNPYLHGGYTNKIITKILNCEAISDTKLDNKYRDYCEYLGFIANENGSWGSKRKFWLLN